MSVRIGLLYTGGLGIIHARIRVGGSSMPIIQDSSGGLTFTGSYCRMGWQSRQFERFPVRDLGAVEGNPSVPWLKHALTGR